MCVEFQGTQVKDVIIKPDAPSTLLLEKHADYIAAYGSKKDDYVSTGLIRALISVFLFWAWPLASKGWSLSSRHSSDDNVPTQRR